jgi:hypothetical protein
MDVREVEAPLLLSRGDQVSPDECEQTVAVAGLALAEQYFGLIDPIDRMVRIRSQG